MPKIMQNLVVLMDPSEEAWRNDMKAGNMILNRFCIDEDAGFESSGVIYLKKLNWFKTNSSEKGKVHSFLRSVSFIEKLNFHEQLIIHPKRTF